MEDVRKDIRFIDSDYNDLFRIKDGDSIKITRYDGEEFIKPCRFIDECHTRVDNDDYHICEFAERMEKNGNQYRAALGGEPILHIIAAKYGEKLQDWGIAMTDEAIRQRVGGDYTVELLYGASKSIVFGALVRGKDGIAVCGIGGKDNTVLTSLHPYWAQKFKRELSPAQRAESKSETFARNSFAPFLGFPLLRGHALLPLPRICRCHRQLLFPVYTRQVYAGEDTGWTPPNGKAGEDGECSCGGGCSCGEEPAPAQESSSCCGPASSCCPDPDASCDCSSDAELPKKEIAIDFLYLDLSICERCIATGDMLDEALRVLTPVFETLNCAVTVNKVNITTEELARQYRFISSPTIRVNGIDICYELIENECENCGDLAGCSVDCRAFVYEGKEYTQPPTAAIVDGILRVLYGGKTQTEQQPYELPENLIHYFKGRENMMKSISIYEPAMCCETGICGVGVDPELIRISTVINNLKKHGITIKRYNLNNFPQEFINNAEINKLINGDGGVDNLPATVLDGKIVKTKKYPVNAELMIWLGIPESYLGGETKTQDGCCCGGDNKSGCC